MRFLKLNSLVLGILLLAFFLRFWQLGQNPPSLTWDEVAWGYNAYSLGLDGRDEFGRFLPLDYLESFGDFKPPMYAYLDILPVKLFGLTEFAVRFPSALFGMLTVLITYFLVRRIFAKRVALLSSLFLAISPWHINLSRAAFEANVATFFLISGVWLLLEWGRGKRWHLILALVSFALSMYTFNTARIVGPLLVILLLVGLGKEVLQRKTEVLIAFIAGFVVLLPLLPFIFTPQASLRFQEVNIFSNVGIVDLTNQEIAHDHNSFFSKVIHNRRLAYGIEYLRHYFDHFNLAFLFIRGDGNPKFSAQDVGQLYLWDLPFFIFGIIFLLRRKEGYWWLIFLWLFLGIVPAATARETPHALRIEATLPTFQIIVAYGFYQFLGRIKQYVQNINMRNLLLAMCYLLLAINVLYYLHGYYTHYPREYSGEWQYGYKEAIDYTSEVEALYDGIYMTTELGRPHIYVAFYHKLTPGEYRDTAVVNRDSFGFVHVDKLGKYYFAKDVAPAEGEYGRNNLYIDIKENVPQQAKIIKTFYLLNGKEALIAYTI